MKIGQGIIIVAALLIGMNGLAETITHGFTTINMDFVDIGYAGNEADAATSRGGVGYNYQIGKFEVTADQWNTVRLSIFAAPGLGDAGSGSGSEPTSNTTWYEAAKFSNWLTSGNIHSGAYQFDGAGVLTGVDRDAAVAAYGTVYVLPSHDEWYKAAYFKSDGSGYSLYATGDAIPTEGIGGENYHSIIGDKWAVGTGTSENNGTFDMNGNVAEWMESAADGTLDSLTEDRAIRGGAYGSTESGLRSLFNSFGPPEGEGVGTGFRIAAIPEPSSIALIGLVSGGVLIFRRCFSI